MSAMSDIAAGQRIDDFEILEIAGRGGMGVVYRARQVSVDRIVAFKLIAAEIGADPDYLARFAREARVAAAVEHPHVVSVHAAGRYGQRPYIVMQWIDGNDLHTLLEEHGAMEPARACSIATQLASALDAIHERGMLHRDLKPANVLRRRVKGRDHVYLTDFGIAKFLAPETAPLTKAGYIVGTPGYIAPECIRGSEGDHRSDIYAMGCVMFECLAGERSFTHSNEISLYWAHANDPRPMLSERRPHLGDRFDAALARAMAIAPHERYQSATEFSDALQAALHSGERRSPAALVSAATTPAPATEPTPPAAPVSPTPVVAAPAPSAAPTPRAPATPPPASRPRVGAPALGFMGLIVVASVAVAALALTGKLSGGTSDPGSRVTPPPPAQPGAPPPAAGSPRTVAQDRSAILAVFRRYETAYSAKDIDGLRLIFSPGITRHGLAAGGCADARGRPAVLQQYRDQFRLPIGQYRFQGLQPSAITVDGPRARADLDFSIGGSRSGTASFDLARSAGAWRVSKIDAHC
jgi:hypothetical protein